MKRLLWLALLLLLLVGLAACNTTTTGGGNEPVDDTGVDEIPMIPATGSDWLADGDTVGELADDQLVVTIMSSSDLDTILATDKPESPSSLVQAMSVWRETYGGAAEVKIMTVQYSEHNTVLAALVAGGESYDVVPANDANYPLWPATRLTVPLTLYRNRLAQFDETLFDKSLMEHFKWEGRYYATVNTTSAEMSRYYIIYNKTKFDDAGEKTPLEHWQDGNWNWTQFVKTAKAMTGDGSFGFTSWGLFPYFAPYAMARINDDATVSLDVDSPQYVRYLTEVYKLYQVDKAARNDWDLQNWTTLIPLNTDAMCLGSLSHLQTMVTTVERKETGADLRIAPVYVFDPTGETVPKPYSYIYGYSISAAAVNPEAGAELIRLNALLTRNINQMLKAEGEDFVSTYLTDEEKAMKEVYETYPVVMDPIRGVGAAYELIDRNMVYDFYYGDTDVGIQAIIDSRKPMLQAEFDDFNRVVEVAINAAGESYANIPTEAPWPES